MYCADFSTYYYSPDFMLLSFHATLIISLPCHALAFYCVLFKTPKEMESVKMSMLGVCFWTAVLDVQITVLVAPFITVPAIAAAPMGLLRYFDVDKIVQSLLCGIALIGVASALSCLFANRYSRITSRYRKHQEWFIYIFNAMISSSIGVIILSGVPRDQPSALRQIFEDLPCLPYYVRSYQFLVISTDLTRIGSCIVALVALFIAQYAGFLIATTHYLLYVKVSHMSRRTKQLQTRFLISIALQIFIPVFILVTPWTYTLYSFLFNYYNQFFNNLLVLDTALHGTFSSVCMLLIHKPYRQAIVRVENRKFKLFYTSSTVKPVSRVFIKANAPLNQI